MKKVFHKKDLKSILGNCYDEKAMNKVVGLISNGDDTKSKATVFEILDTKFPTTDKYWFVLNNCGVSKKQMRSLALSAASIAMIRYNELNPNTVFGSVLELLKDSTIKATDIEVIQLKEQVQDIINRSVDDIKYIAIGMLHMFDVIDSINGKKKSDIIINHINSAITYFDKALVSRNDLKEELINELRNLFS